MMVIGDVREGFEIAEVPEHEQHHEERKEPPAHGAAIEKPSHGVARYLRVRLLSSNWTGGQVPKRARLGV